MKTLTILLLLISTTCYSQKKFTTYVGLGTGGVIENKKHIPGCTFKGALRIAGFVSQYYKVNDKISIGLQALTSGDLIGVGKCSEYNVATNTRTVSSNSMSANSLLLRGRYFIGNSNIVKAYLDLGVGTTTYTYGSITVEQGSISKSSFALSSEIGVEIAQKLNIACVGIFGGKTPFFTGFDSFSMENKVLQSIKSQQIYLTVGYRLFHF
jgi:opacity protein-like surface antigen